MDGSLIDLSKYRLERAREDLQTARDNFENGSYRASVNRSYYAIFHALRAVTALDDFDSSTTYAGQLREVIFDMFKKNDIEIPYSRIQIDILSDADMNKEE